MGSGFNLVGNPYVASLFANTQGGANNNVLTANKLVLEEMTLWFFNGSTGKFQTTNLGTTTTGSELLDIAPIQGFFVKAKAGGDVTESFKITKAMQTHNDNITSLKSYKNKFEIDLSVNSNEKSSKTSVWYLENTTTDFDNGYDSSTFGGATLSVFTELVTNSAGKKLAIQSLPNEKYEDMVIPIGVIATIGSEITFSTEAVNIPATYNVYLADRVNKTFTRLDEAESEYTTTVSEASTKGRFYMHTKTTSTLNTDTKILNSVSIYKTDNSNLQIVGLEKGKVSVKLYNILGKQVSNSSFEASNNEAIKLPRLAKGVYIVNLQTEKGILNKKIVLE